MDLLQEIEENPIVTVDIAYNIIACATIMQYGIPYPENIRAAIKRIKTNIAILMEKDPTIEHRWREENPNEYALSEDINYDEYFGYGFSPHESTVNIKQLITSYNHGLELNGLSPIMSISNSKPITHSQSDSILSLITSVANTVKNIFDRDNKIKNDQLDSMLNEISTQIVDPTICKLLPEIKTTLKAAAKDKITQGRPSTVDTKKMRAAIDLGEKFKDKTRKYLTPKEINDYLKRHHSELSISDREHVADVYLESKEK